MSACEFASSDSKENARTSATVTTSTGVPIPPPIEIHSSLDGIAVLPHRIRWTATTSLPAAQVQEVRFLLDRRVWWVDRRPPFTYGEEGAYLVTSWMDADVDHRFVVRVVAKDGSKWTHRVDARIRKARYNINDLPAGIWGRLPPASLEDPPPPGQLGPWTADLNINTALWIGKSYKRAFVYEVSSQGKRTLRIGKPISIGRPVIGGFSFGWRSKGYQCGPDGPPATYSWSFVKGRFVGHFNGADHYATYLVLDAEKDPCEPRRNLLEGVWEMLD
jgi:hypothetical protein